MTVSANDGFFAVNQVHADGEIWASLMSDVDEDLQAAGLSRADVEALVLEAMSFTPANPTMLDARNALILADSVLHGGTYACDLWDAFAGRGFGVHAALNDVPFGSTPDGGGISYFETWDTPPACGLRRLFELSWRGGSNECGSVADSEGECTVG